jgi:beta-lactamase class A
VAPDDWQADFGEPLTEALPVVVVQRGQAQHLIVQVFLHAALVLNESNAAAPAPQLLPVGADYLQTFGPPSVAPAPRTAVWADTSDGLYGAADPSSATVAHIGPGYPLVLTGQAAWAGTTLLYQATWQLLHATRSGWIPATALTFEESSSGPPSAGFDALDPTLGAYLSGLGTQVGVAVYDVTRGVYYEYNEQMPVIMGSTIKVPIMLSLLAQDEAQNAAPDSDQLSLLTPMIEQSDNNAAYDLYYGLLNNGGAIASYMSSIGISGITIDPTAFGWSTATPLAMVQLLSRLQAGTILNLADRETALSLMESIAPDQQHGVGYTAPTGAIVAMKDGWVTGPDGLWVADTVGIVGAGHETYVIAVYTQDNSSLDQGWAIAEHICGAVAQDLA